jgi:hypothetical protein
MAQVIEWLSSKSKALNSITRRKEEGREGRREEGRR